MRASWVVVPGCTETFGLVLYFSRFQLKIKHFFFLKSLREQNITSALMGVSDAYGSYGSYGSSLGILKFFADVGKSSLPFDIRLCCGSIQLRPNLFTSDMKSLRHSALIWLYSALPKSLHAQHGIVEEFGFNVVVFSFAVVVFCFALIRSCPVWYSCGIQLCSGGIRLCPNLFMPGVVLFWYSASLWQYLALS